MVWRQCKAFSFSHGESLAIDFNREQPFKIDCSHIKMEKVPKCEHTQDHLQK